MSAALRSLYVVREKNGLVFLFTRKPMKSNFFGRWLRRRNGNQGQVIYLGCSKKIFPEVKWTDDEPTKITGLTYPNPRRSLPDSFQDAG